MDIHEWNRCAHLRSNYRCTLASKQSLLQDQCVLPLCFDQAFIVELRDNIYVPRPDALCAIRASLQLYNFLFREYFPLAQMAQIVWNLFSLSQSFEEDNC